MVKRSKKKRINKKIFISRILLLIAIILGIILLIRNVGRHDMPDFDVSVIFNNEDITSKLKYEPYVNKDNVLYLSIEDIKELFDLEIYYEEDTKKIITTYETKVGAIDVNENMVQINSANITLSAGILDYNGNYYIPLTEELKSLYNIEATVSQNSAVISSLYEELNTVTTTKKISLKEKTSQFSKTLQKIDANTEIIFIQDAEKKNWIKVLTYEGNIGYIKNKNITEKTQKRVDMGEMYKLKTVQDIEGAIEVNSSKLNNDSLANFNSRKEIVDSIISDIVKDENFNVNINLKDSTIDSSKIERFIIELIPRLKEMGAGLAVTNNDNVLNSDFLNKCGI